MCGGDNKHCVVVEATRTTHSRRTRNTKAGVVSRACSLGCARTTRHPPFPQTKKKKKKKNGEKKKQRTKNRKSSVRRWRRSSR
nr:MAG TPA: hypothetical protein [Caudoviricetes sp.]